MLVHINILMRRMLSLYTRPPVRGMFTLGKSVEDTKRRTNRGDTKIEYFVPFKKNSNELAWSKAVLMHSRCYASTYEECVVLYNKLISNAINWHMYEISKLEQDLIK